MAIDQFVAAALTALLLTGPGFPAPAGAEEPATIEVTIRDHRFSPAEIHVPAGKPVILHITNADDTVEEFDSVALQVEKVIVAGHYATVRLRPLGPGRFPFMGEYHAETAKGVVISE
jgi:heme/copper-type cytochrome/quinol oxidase subunit 2